MRRLFVSGRRSFTSPCADRYSGVGGDDMAPMVTNGSAEGAAQDLADRRRRCAAFLQGLCRGDTVREAAAAGSVSVPTIYRWAKADPLLRGDMREARRQGKAARAAAPARTICYTCPRCKDRISVRNCKRRFRLWLCPGCGWWSWLPPAPLRCSRCGRPTVWSSGRRTVTCVECGVVSKPA